MAYISEYAYIKNTEELNEKLSALRMDLLATFDVEKTQAILVSFDRFIVLAFRGTEREDIAIDVYYSHMIFSLKKPK